jgi:hypothetical protein
MSYMKDLDIRLRNGGDDAIAAACELMPKWISVWEQLPALNTRVLVLVDCKPHEHPHTIGAFMFYGNWELDAEYEEATEPSYWMPLSDPPEVK